MQIRWKKYQKSRYLNDLKMYDTNAWKRIL